jgi:lactobin A/cerein 7B family class IIb bacteriocin
MNSSVISGARGVNRIEAFLDSQRAAGLHEANPAELDNVEGGILPLIALGVECFCIGFTGGYFGARLARYVSGR